MLGKNETGAAVRRGRPYYYGLKGSSDIVGLLDGLFFALEVKTGSGRQSNFQKDFEGNGERLRWALCSSQIFGGGIGGNQKLAASDETLRRIRGKLLSGPGAYIRPLTTSREQIGN